MTTDIKNQSDRTLLEKAAKAAGIPDQNIHYKWWNPLTDDGDALRLSVKLGLTFHTSMTLVTVGVEKAFGYEERFDDHNGDEYAATRRAIVRAAASIGESLE